MNDSETIARFIFLRSQGWSFNRIQVELNVSKPTLIKWSRQHQFEIANLRATETEALAEVVFGQRHERWRTLAGQLKKLEAEIEKRDLEEIPASRLHAIAAALRAEINREFGHVHFSEACKDIPREEFIYDREGWSV
jgi:transposase